MRTALLIVLVLVGLYAARYSAYNTIRMGEKLCEHCRTYYVHREHNDKKDAAALLGEIDARVLRLIEYLEKYTNKHVPADPAKSGRIDIIAGSELFNPSANILQREYLQDRIAQLTERYSSGRMYELSPHNIQGDTAYTEDKRTLVLCLRSKEPGTPLHDINTMMFVVLHELSHMMNDSWGHGHDFWVLFKFMLKSAEEAGVYKPENYRVNPRYYCGMKLSYNPYFDPLL